MPKLTPTAADHARTPDNTPIPGGGAWTWDAEAGAWVETRPVQSAPAQE